MLNVATIRPTSLGDLRITSLQFGGLYKLPFVAAPPLTLNTGGGVPANALMLNGVPITLNGRFITLLRVP